MTLCSSNLFYFYIKELQFALNTITELWLMRFSCEESLKQHSFLSFAIFLYFRYFNVIGSDPDGRLGEAPRPELREHGRISGACFDAARGIIPGLKVFPSPMNIS